MFKRRYPCIKQFLVLLVFLLVIGASVQDVPVTKAASVDGKTIKSPFNDVSANEPGQVYITYLNQRGIIKGFPDGSYHPGETLTRAQAAVVIVKAAGLKTLVVNNSSFKDLPTSHWAAGYINAAEAAGYLAGFTDGSFHPEESLTRAQGISLIMRLCSQKEKAPLPVLQDMSSSHWAAADIGTALVLQMLETPKDGNQIYPEAPITRANMARALAILLTKDPDLNQQELIGKLKVKKGTVEVKIDSEKTQTINTTAIVRAGHTITTGKDGEAEINYPDGSGILLKNNSQLKIKTAIGRTYIKKDGNPGTAVEDLQVELTNGKLFGALASKYTTSQETEETAANNKYSKIASRDNRYDLMAAQSSAQPWFKTAEKKKVKVKVDMPWGVAAIRGTFWSNYSSDSGCGMSLLHGDGSLTSGGQTQTLSPGQSSTSSSSGAPPSPPAPMSPSESRDWVQQQGWVGERAGDIQGNQEAGDPGSAGEGQGDEQGDDPGSNLLNTLNNGLNQAAQIAASTISGSSGGGGGSGTVTTKVAAPTASPNAGNYNSAQHITLSSTTDGSTIYYTTDGSDPTNSSTRLAYNTAINISSTTTIKAYATKAGMSDSEVVSFTYTIYLSPPAQVAAPIASPPAGTYDAAVNISLSSATEGATIYYTTDSSDPTNSSTRLVYSTAINISSTTTIKAYAIKAGVSDSNVVSFTYTINQETPLAYQSAFISNDNKTVTLAFNKTLINNTDDNATLKAAVTLAADGIDFQPLAAGDTVSLTGTNLVINLASALSGNNNKIKVAESTLKDTAGNVLTTEVVTDSLAAVAIPSLTSGWNLRNPLPTGNDLIWITYGAGKYMAVGYNGTIMSSSDGMSWSTQVSGITSELSSVKWNGSQWIAVGEYLLSSLDGITWSIRDTGTINYLNGVNWNGIQWIATGAFGTIINSPDGVNWSIQTSGTNKRLYNVNCNGSQWLAVGEGGTILSSIDGISWSTQTSGTTRIINNVNWNGSQWIAVGDSGTILSSPDGINWTTRTSGTTKFLDTVDWDGNQWVVVGEDGTILSSPDGINWTTHTSGTTRLLYGLTWNGDQWLACGEYGTILRSSDGVSWSTWSSGITDWLQNMSWNGSQWLVVGDSTILSSLDGVSWTTCTSGTTNCVNIVDWNGNQWVAVGINGTVMSSLDGISWITQTSGTNKWLSTLIWNGSQWLAIGENGTILSSPDGTSWTGQSSGTTNWLTGLSWNGSQWLVVGNGGIILTSNDGVVWTVQSSGTINDLGSITWNGSSWLVVGSGGTVLSSSDGTTWLTQTSGTTRDLKDVAWNGSQYLAVGDYIVLSSPDGINWTARTAGLAALIKDVEWNGSEWLAVGDRGTILSSPDGITWTEHSSGTNYNLRKTAWNGSYWLVIGDVGTILQSN